MHEHIVLVPQPFVEAAVALAVEIAGGCTVAAPAQGYWRNPATGQVERDVVHGVTVFEDGTAARDAIAAYLFRNHESCVAYKTDGVPVLVDAPVQATAAR